MTAVRGAFVVDEIPLPIVDVRLDQGCLIVVAELTMTSRNEAPLKAVRPGAMTMLYGEDGCLVVRGGVAAEEWSVPAIERMRPGDVLNVTYRLNVGDKMTDQARAGVP